MQIRHSDVAATWGTRWNTENGQAGPLFNLFIKVSNGCCPLVRFVYGRGLYQVLIPAVLDAGFLHEKESRGL